MNKLWVRLQHQGHSRDRGKREQERRDLKLLVGSSLVRLAQLDGLDVSVYMEMVLPSVLEEVVSCRDVIAQDYLMEVIIQVRAHTTEILTTRTRTRNHAHTRTQVFPDDFHLTSLDAFLTATAQLHRNANVKHIVVSLVDRFAAYAASSPTTRQIPADVRLFDLFWTQITALVAARPEFSMVYVTDLMRCLVNLSLKCYPTELAQVCVRALIVWVG